MGATEQYIFENDAQELFYDKLERLHDEVVYSLLLSGVAPRGTKLEEVKMTKNPQASLKYCQRVVGGLVNIKPEIIVKFLEDKELKLECIFTKIIDGEQLNHLFMIQNVMNWPQLEVFSCQIWYLGETGVKEIQKHWS